MFPMSLIVQKFGGTSVADTDSLRIVAERIIDCKKNGNDAYTDIWREWPGILT